eukprot:TRINITY_DN107004_c0_g1_i1.p1 TRINITY_DN107004_c0_g1~~TRINITY_DN107004_c0_g1_i1.p1  ORF type:complete len:243 (+),score=56.96 TRINITY_DN107004_c0_g1_i1:37-729(+)
MAGKAIAGGLVEAAAAISPYEDVRGYLQQSLLPVLAPSIEELLHHVHATGELQRVLREKAESERRAIRRMSENEPEAVAQSSKAEPRRNSRTTPTTGSPVPATAGATGAEKDQETGGSRERVRRPSVSSTGNSATGADCEKNPASDAKAKDAVEEPSFDPLLWLSENIRKASQGETSQYRERITERVVQQIKAMEAAEEAERLKAEAEAAAALLAEQGMVAPPEGTEAAS